MVGDKVIHSVEEEGILYSYITSNELLLIFSGIFLTSFWVALLVEKIDTPIHLFGSPSEVRETLAFGALILLAVLSAGATLVGLCKTVYSVIHYGVCVKNKTGGDRVILTYSGIQLKNNFYAFNSIRVKGLSLYTAEGTYLFTSSFKYSNDMYFIKKKRKEMVF